MNGICKNFEERKKNKMVTNLRHGMFGTGIHKIWDGMIQRCRNPKSKDYKHWGARGTAVCDSWRKFVNFYKDMGDPEPGTSLDRIDNDGDYRKGNCRWATQKEQHRNKRNNRMISFKGKTKAMSAWAEELGINKNSLEWRLNNGWSTKRAFTQAIGRTK